MKTIIFIIFITIITIIISAETAKAASLQSAKDTLSTSAPSTASNPIKSMHTIAFKTASEVPTSGKIAISFPTLSSSDSNNSASPSASTFQLNGLSDASVKINGLSGDQTFTGTYTNPTSGTSPTITLTLTGTTTIPAGTTLTILLGCTASSATSCTTPNPLIINPTKTKAWRETIKTRTSSNTDIDEISVQVATVPKVVVQATVPETFTVAIDGISDATAVNTGNGGCTNLETTNTGFASLATAVNLGTLQYTPSSINTKIGNLSAQIISVATNAYNGYAITATASGHLTNTSTGFAITDSTIPSVFPAGANFFGIHPCGLDVDVVTWVTGADQACSSKITGSTGNLCKYALPTSTDSLTLASDSTGPIGNDVSPGNGITSIEYAAGIDNSVPGGSYSATIRYTVTPTF